MKTIISICFILLLYSDYFSQVYSSVSTLFMPQGYSINTLNGYGTSRLYNSNSNLNFVNPASLYKFKKPAIGLSYEVQTKIKDGWFAGIGGYKINDYSPKAAGFVYPYKDLRIGLAYGQTYNWQLDFGPIPITTMEQPEGTGEYFNPVNKTKLHSYSLLASLDQENIFTDDILSFGIRLTGNILSEYEKILSISAEGSADKIGASLGIIYRYNIDRDKYFESGFTYEMPVELYGDIQVKGNELRVDPDPEGEGYIPAVVSEKYRLTGYVPGKVCVDYNFSLIKTITLLGSFNYNYWKSDEFSNYENQVELAGSVVFGVGSNLNASLGYYKTDFRLKEDDYFRINGLLDAFYLTGGLVWKKDIYSLDVAIADSHLLSGEKRKQTIAKVSMGLEF